MKVSVLIIVLALGASYCAFAQDIPTLPGKDLEPVSPESVLPLARVCESCHGQDGQSTRDEVPVIAGKPAAEIVAALEAFYYFERHCPKVDYENAEGAIESRSMCDITNELNQQEALALARYFEAAGNGSGQ